MSKYVIIWSQGFTRLSQHMDLYLTLNGWDIRAGDAREFPSIEQAREYRTKYLRPRMESEIIEIRERRNVAI